MKQLKLIAFLLFLSLSLFSQDLKNIDYGLEINPKLVTQLFKNKTSVETSNLIGASIAGNIYLNFSPRHSIKTGLNFSLIKVAYLDYSITFGCDFDGSMGDFKNSFINTNYAIYYLGVPLENKFDLSTKINHPYFKLGGEVLFKIAKSGKRQIHECGISILEGKTLAQLSPFLLMLDIGIGYEMTFKNNRKFYIETKVEYAANKLLKKDKVFGDVFNNSHLLNVGLVAGIRFK